MEDGIPGVAVGLLLGLLIFVFCLAAYNLSPDGQCAETYGTNTREFAMCVYELSHKLRTQP